MAFTGTLDKCKACDKTVYVVDMLSLEGVPYHKSCFKCSHCKGFLSMSTYSSMDGILYCKPHFEQLFKESGNFSKNFAKSAEKQSEVLNRAPSKLSSMFSGTQDKCATCSKTVYPLEKVTLEGESYHKTCFRCAHGGCPLTHSSYAALDGILYCKHHFAQLFMEKGNYSHVLQAAKKNVTQPKEPSAEEPEAPPAAEPEPEPEHPKDQSDQSEA
ncbi:putative transcription factor interactor and regulator LIM family [Rosa chinensis]|uniref:Putative transcription factor interactor and regulator LIM family n=1 Tax=Rosa chinensis TaxID=74649 RepID=A0A2P6SGZ9_ROSCH|nr:LIM domain-containing protein PLIM2b [Rosa chinensis]PRQ57964.1 putative transcription factor interactor and regulator LIM family [Rosa chinensis]